MENIVEKAGCLVAIRTFGGVPVVRALLATTVRAAFVCVPERYDEIARGAAPAPLHGFPIEDAFMLDAEHAAQIRAGTAVDWRALPPLRH